MFLRFFVSPPRTALRIGAASACDSGLDWNEKGIAFNGTLRRLDVDRTAWPKSMRLKAEEVMQSEGAWPFGADATSFSATTLGGCYPSFVL